MLDVLIYVLPVIALIAGAFLLYSFIPLLFRLSCIIRIDLTKAS